MTASTLLTETERFAVRSVASSPVMVVEKSLTRCATLQKPMLGPATLQRVKNCAFEPMSLGARSYQGLDGKKPEAIPR